MNINSVRNSGNFQNLYQVHIYQNQFFHQYPLRYFILFTPAEVSKSLCLFLGPRELSSPCRSPGSTGYSGVFRSSITLSLQDAPIRKLSKQPFRTDQLESTMYEPIGKQVFENPGSHVLGFPHLQIATCLTVGLRVSRFVIS